MPFFACLIALALARSLRKKSAAWFILFCFFLGLGSFYTYQPSLIFVPVFFISIFLLRKEFFWLKPKTIVAGFAVFFALFYPFVHLQFIEKVDLLANIKRSYIQNPLEGNFFINSLTNLKDNSYAAFQALFLASRGRLLYGAALEAPLLIHWVMLPLILVSLIISIYKRNALDKIFLVWLGLGLLFPLSYVNFFQPRYIIIVLPLFLIMAGSLVRHKGRSWPLGITLCALLVFTEIFQLVHYYVSAPTHLEECRRNSYGSKEAAYYLSQAPDIENYQVITDVRMTVLTYLSYFRKDLDLSGQKEGKGIYYVIWAPESHPEDYWHGMFRYKYNGFRQEYPNSMPVSTIYYPTGPKAIYIFKEDHV